MSTIKLHCPTCQGELLEECARVQLLNMYGEPPRPDSHPKNVFHCQKCGKTFIIATRIVEIDPKYVRPL